MLLDIEVVTSDLLSHLITEEVNHMRDDIEQSLEEEMQKKIVMRKTKLHASLKIELLEAIQIDIASFIKKSILELNNDIIAIHLSVV